MSEWSPKRFWKSAGFEETDDGFAVRLDDRVVRTPGKRVLAVPTRAMAEKIAAEWDAQEEAINPLSMPWTRSANTALDKVGPQREAVENHLAEYAGTDLLSYRADGPAGLEARQAAGWDPVLDWLTSRYDVRLAVTRGVMPVPQDPDALERLSRAMTPMSDFHLTAFHDLVALTGSFALGLATAEDAFPAMDLWAASRIDEDWQIEQWGEDEEASAAAERKKSAFIHATEFFRAAS